MDLLKSALLNAYYVGSQPVRWWNDRQTRADGRAPAVILFYHRVADNLLNEWSITNEMFARQIEWLENQFEFVTLKEAQRRIRSGINARPTVSITFDDGYAENCQSAIPLVVKKQIPCTYFVTANNVLNGEPFDHDLVMGNRLPPNNLEQLLAMSEAGIEIGAHCCNHVDLGRITDKKLLYDEIAVSGQILQEAIKRPVRYFAFPIGQYANLNAQAFEIAREAGYEGVCSAYGGYNFPGEDPFHLQRIATENNLISLKNRATVDPRKIKTLRYVYEQNVANEAYQHQEVEPNSA